jgi:hypothetical protein
LAQRISHLELRSILLQLVQYILQASLVLLGLLELILQLTYRRLGLEEPQLLLLLLLVLHTRCPSSRAGPTPTPTPAPAAAVTLTQLLPKCCELLLAALQLLGKLRILQLQQVILLLAVLPLLPLCLQLPHVLDLHARPHTCVQVMLLLLSDCMAVVACCSNLSRSTWLVCTGRAQRGELLLHDRKSSLVGCQLAFKLRGYVADLAGRALLAPLLLLLRPCVGSTPRGCMR